MSQAPGHSGRLAAIRWRTHTLLEPGSDSDLPSKIVDISLIVLILVNVICAMLATVKTLNAQYGEFFEAFEFVSIMVFTVEYVLRLWSAGSNPGIVGWRGLARYASRPLIVIDLLALLPFYLALFFPDMRMLRILRLLRFFRVAKLGRYSTALQTMGRVFILRKAELSMTALIGALAMCFAATLIYFAEHEAQPEVFPSIPSSLWWAITTMSTVGYGDTYPITIAGRMIGAAVQVVGVGMLALPMGLLASAFFDELPKAQAEEKVSSGICPECGQRLPESEGAAAAHLAGSSGADA